MINKKALGLFLTLTFGATILLALAARWLGLTLFDTPMVMSQMVVGAAMFIPALSAIITQKWVLKKPLRDLGFRWGKGSAYLKTYVVILWMYVLNYAITWAFIQKPDLSLSAFLTQYNITGGLPMPAGSMLTVLTLITLVGAPIFNMIPSLVRRSAGAGFCFRHWNRWGRSGRSSFPA
jgi:hypothetical protein